MHKFSFIFAQIFFIFIIAYTLCAEPSTPTDITEEVLQSADEPVTPETLRERKDKEGYILNLKDLVNQSKKKIDQVNNKINEQARMRRNQQREEKMREYFDKAMRLSEDGKFEEAQEEWKKAIKISEHPEMKDYISQSVKKTKRLENAMRTEEAQRLRRLEAERGYSINEVEAKYAEAVSLFKQKKWIESKDSFELVDEMFPDHKATHSYIMLIEQEIAAEQKEIIERRLRDEALAKRKEKELWKKELEEKELERQRSINERAEIAYAEAVRLYKAKQFKQAKEKFREVVSIQPEFRSSEQYLDRIDEDIKFYEEYLEEQNRKALQKEAEEKRIQEELEKQRVAREKERLEKEALQRKLDEAEFIYKAAVNLYKKKDYSQAKEKFLEVKGLQPDYKKTNDYINNMEIVIQKEELKRKEQELAKAREEEAKRKKDELAKMRAEEKQKKEEQAREAKVEALKKQQEELTRKEEERHKQKLSAEQAEEAKRQEQVDALKAKQEALVENEETRRQKESTAALVKAQDQKNDSQIQELYKQAIDAFNQDELESAQIKFTQVQAIFPDYRATPSYLKRIDQKLAQSQTPTRAKSDEKSAKPAKINEEKKAAEVEKSDAQIVKKAKALEPKKSKIKKDDVSVMDRKPVKKALSQIDSDPVVEKAEKERRERLTNEANKKYEQALDFYKNKNFEEAKIKFIQVEALLPNYKSTLSYLARIDEDIASESQRKSDQKIEDIQKVLSSEDFEKKIPKVKETAKSKDVTKPKKEEMAEPKQALKKPVKAAPPIPKKVKTSKPKTTKTIKAKADPLEVKYDQALKLYDQRQWKKAHNKFIEIENIKGEYKDSRKYLTEINQKIAEEEKRTLEMNKVKEEARAFKEQEQARLKEEAAAKKAMEQQKRQEAKEKKQSEQAKIAQAPVKEKAPKTSELETETEIKYQQGINLYKAQKFTEAQSRFEEINVVAPGYKDSDKYLTKISKKIEQQQAYLDRQKQREEKQQAQLEEQGELADALGVYQQAMSAYKQGDYEGALKLFEEVNRIKPGYAKTNRYINLSVKKIQNQVKSRKSIVGPTPVERINVQDSQPTIDAHAFSIEELYTEAVRLYKDHYYREARQMFEKVQKIEPGYRASDYYICCIDDKLRRGFKDVSHAQVKFPVQRNVELERYADMVYKQAMDSYRKDEMEMAEKKFAELDEILADGQLSPQYLAKVRKRMVKDRQEIEGDLAKKFQEAGEPLPIIEPEGLVDDTDIQPPAIAEPAGLTPQEKEARIDYLMSSQEAAIELKKIRREKDRLQALKMKDLERQKRVIKHIQDIKEKEKTLAFKDQVGGLYEEGVELYKKGQLKAAKAKFNAVHALSPNYKAVQNFLDVITLRMQEHQEIMKLKAERQIEIEEETKIREQKEEEARLAAEAKQKEIDAKNAEKEKIAEEKRQAKLKAEEEKKKALEEKLKAQEEKKKAKEEEKRVKEEKRQAQLAEKKKIEEEARLKKEEERRHQEQLRRQEQEALRAQSNELSKKADQSYKEALKLYREGKWDESQKKFDEFEQILSSDQLPPGYAAKLRQQLVYDREKLIKEEETNKKKEEERKAKEEALRVKEEAKKAKAEAAQKAKEDAKKAKEEALKAKAQADQKAKEDKEASRKEPIKSQTPEVPMAHAEVEKLSEEKLTIKEKKEHQKTQAKSSVDEAARERQAQQLERERRAKENEVVLKRLQEDERKERLLREKELSRQRKQERLERERRAKENEMFLKRQYAQERKEKALKKAELAPVKESSDSQTTGTSLSDKEKWRKEMAQKEAQYRVVDEQPLPELDENQRKEALSQREKDLKLSKENRIKDKETQRELKEIQARVEQAYKEGRNLFREGQNEMAEQKMAEAEALLKDERLFKGYVNKMLEQINAERGKAQEKIDQANAKKEEEMDAQSRERQAKLKELEALEKKIQAEEERLAKEKQKEEKRLRKIKQAEEEKLAKEQALEEMLAKKEEEKKRKEEERLAKIKAQEEERLAKVKAEEQERLAKAKKIVGQATVGEAEIEFVTEKSPAATLAEPKETAFVAKESKQVASGSSKKERKSSASTTKTQESKGAEITEVDREKELERLVKERQEALRKEREKIRQEFEYNLDQLYIKAVKYFESGDAKQASRLFKEINDMRSGYKKTDEYLEKIYRGNLPQTKSEKPQAKSKKSKTQISRNYEQTNVAPNAARRDIVSDALNNVEKSLK